MSKNLLQIDNKIPIIAILGALATCLVYGVTTNTKVDNLKETTNLEFVAIKSQIATQQATLDLRGQYGISVADKYNRLATDIEVSKNDIAVSKDRLDKLEIAISNINDNIQTIANRILNEKKPR